MKILVTTGDFDRYLAPNFHHLLQQLGQRAEVSVSFKSGNINDLMAETGTEPDYIFVNEYGETNSPEITGLDNCPVPFGVLLHDLHYNIPTRRQLLRQNKVEHIFTLYRDKFYEWYPEFWDKVHWLPHQVNPDIFHDYGQSKDIDCLFMGAVHPWVYPLRNLMLKKLKGAPGFVYHEHPGYRYFSETEAGSHFIWDSYAREINRARLFITCNSRYGYPLAKYLEVLACNTLLLAPANREIEDLGLIPGIHFAAIDDSNFADKIKHYLAHPEEAQTIARQGHDLVHSLHTTQHRAAQLLNIIEHIISP